MMTVLISRARRLLPFVALNALDRYPAVTVAELMRLVSAATAVWLELTAGLAAMPGVPCAAMSVMRPMMQVRLVLSADRMCRP
jgi:hypothetical protein